MFFQLAAQSPHEGQSLVVYPWSTGLPILGPIQLNIFIDELDTGLGKCGEGTEMGGSYLEYVCYNLEDMDSLEK